MPGRGEEASNNSPVGLRVASPARFDAAVAESPATCDASRGIRKRVRPLFHPLSLSLLEQRGVCTNNLTPTLQHARGSEWRSTSGRRRPRPRVPRAAPGNEHEPIQRRLARTRPSFPARSNGRTHIVTEGSLRGRLRLGRVRIRPRLPVAWRRGRRRGSSEAASNQGLERRDIVWKEVDELAWEDLVRQAVARVQQPGSHEALRDATTTPATSTRTAISLPRTGLFDPDPVPAAHLETWTAIEDACRPEQLPIERPHEACGRRGGHRSLKVRLAIADVRATPERAS